MNPSEDYRPWEQLEVLLEEEAAPDRIEAFLDGLASGDIGITLSRLREENRARLMELLPATRAAKLVGQFHESQAVQALEDLPPGTAAAVLHELPSAAQADIIGELDAADAEAILAEMAPDEAGDARTLCRYSDDVAGGLMITERLAFPEELTIEQVLHDVRVHGERYAGYPVLYVFVVDRRERLVGVLRIRDLLFGPRNRTIGELMISQPVSVRDTDTLDQLRGFFDRHGFIGAPVTDADGRLLGVMQRADVQEALAARTGSDYLKSQGIVGGEELRSMPWFVRSRRRLAWLSVNVALNLVAASVIALYQETLAAVIALAVFLPIISDMSGCSGNQAVAVSMRELTLGLIRPTETLRVWLKEVGVGAVNGLALGLLVAAVAWLWKGSPALGLVVGLAMGLNTIVAVSIGGMVPLMLQRGGMDPALASGPILTTVTDLCGFALLLSIATALLPWL